jgi:hypothetical protein
MAVASGVRVRVVGRSVAALGKLRGPLRRNRVSVEQVRAHCLQHVSL